METTLKAILKDRDRLRRKLRKARRRIREIEATLERYRATAGMYRYTVKTMGGESVVDESEQDGLPTTFHGYVVVPPC